MKTHTLVVRIRANLSAMSVREYVATAVSGWSGSFHPDHPLFGLKLGRDVTVRYAQKKGRK